MGYLGVPWGSSILAYEALPIFHGVFFWGRRRSGPNLITTVILAVTPTSLEGVSNTVSNSWSLCSIIRCRVFMPTIVLTIAVYVTSMHST